MLTCILVTLLLMSHTEVTNRVKADDQQQLLCLCMLVACAEMLEEQQRVMQANSRLRTSCGPGCCGKDCGWVVEKHKLSKCPDERLADGLKRLPENNTWNQWQWDSKSPAFHSVHSFW